MTRRRALWLGVVGVLLAGLAVLTPGSPLYLPQLLNRPGQYEGHSAAYWAGALDSPDAEVRRRAAFCLGAIGTEAPEAVPALAAALAREPDPQVRRQVSLALYKMVPASKAAVPALAGALRDEEPTIRMNAVMTLFKLGAEAKPAVPALVAAVQDERNREDVSTFFHSPREMAIRALGRVGPGAAEAVPALAAALGRDDPQVVRIDAAQALGSIGPAARAAVPQLRAMAQDNNDAVRQAAEEALRAVGSPPDAARADKGEEPELAEAERQYLWRIEHHGNALVRHGFGPLAAALRKGDGPALTRLLADDFAGTDLRDPHHVRAAVPYAEVERVEDAGGAPVPLDRAAFVARLLRLRAVFGDRPPQVKLALMALHPRRRGDLDGPWEGTAQLRLHGEHAPGAPAEVVALLRYEVPRPTAEALARPGWLRAAGLLQVQTARAPRYLFAEVAKQRGLRAAGLHDNWKDSPFFAVPGGAYVCDFDRDGILDVLISDTTGWALYRGRPGGIFEDVTEHYGLRGVPPDANGLAAWVDIDGDGWPDLLIGGRVYRNEQGQHFANYTDRCNLRLPRDGRCVAVADYDHDGKLDLYVTRVGRPGRKSWLEGRTDDSNGNHLFRNKGGWQFEDVTERSGTQGGYRSTFAAAWLDANDDGWPDLCVINEFGDAVLLVNKGDGTFAPHALADRPADFGSMGLAVGDINNDGHIDIFCADMYSKAGGRIIGNLAPNAYPPALMEKMRRFVGGNQLHLNRGGLKFEQAGRRMQVAAVGWPSGPCLADLDNDGFLDLYATAGFYSSNRDDPDG